MCRERCLSTLDLITYNEFLLACIAIQLIRECKILTTYALSARDDVMQTGAPAVDLPVPRLRRARRRGSVVRDPR